MSGASNGQVTGGVPAGYTPEEELAYLRGQIDMIARLAQMNADWLAERVAARENANGH